MYAATFVGQFARVADAATPSRMPAVGLFLANVVSGAPVDIQQYGRVSNAVFSGLFTSGAPVYVSSGGFPTPTAPTTSGSTIQRIGVADAATSLILGPDPTYFQIAQ